MKKHILLAVLALVLLSFGQCKKNNSSANATGNGNGYYLRFKLNGAAVDYESQAFISISLLSSSGLNTAVAAAYKDVYAGLKNAVTITVFSNNPIAANTGYNDPHKSYEKNGAWISQSVITWYDSTGTAYLTAGLLADSTGHVSLNGVVADSKFTITELTTTYAKGTFSGTIYRSDFQRSAVISEGQFYLKRNQ